MEAWRRKVVGRGNGRWCLVDLNLFRYQLSAISYQLSAISYQLSAISYQLRSSVDRTRVFIEVEIVIEVEIALRSLINYLGSRPQALQAYDPLS